MQNVRTVVDQVIDSLNIDALIRKHKRGGSSGYHPRLLLKLVADICEYINSKQ